VNIVATLNASSVSGASGALQFQLPVKPALGNTGVIGISTLGGGLVWPSVSGTPATQIVFYPVSNRTFGQVAFLVSGSNAPTEITTLNVSDITVGNTYSFGFSGCYQ
jgi:hypothetical protein